MRTLAKSGSSKGNLNVLLVDRCEITRDRLLTHLTDLDTVNHVQTVESYADALKVLLHQPIDILLFDLAYAKDEVFILLNLRHLDRFKHLKVFLMSYEFIPDYYRSVLLNSGATVILDKFSDLENIETYMDEKA